MTKLTHATDNTNNMRKGNFLRVFPVLPTPSPTWEIQENKCLPMTKETTLWEFQMGQFERNLQEGEAHTVGVEIQFLDSPID